MSKPFACTVVTPTMSLFDDEVDYASIPLEDGLIGIVSGREPMLAPLGLGELRLDFPNSSGAGGSRSFLIDGGVVQMSDTKLTILAERAVPAEEIMETEAKAELAEAEARKVPADATDPVEQQDRISHDRKRASLMVRMAQTSKRSGI